MQESISDNQSNCSQDQKCSFFNRQKIFALFTFLILAIIKSTNSNLDVSGNILLSILISSTIFFTIFSFIFWLFLRRKRKGYFIVEIIILLLTISFFSMVENYNTYTNFVKYDIEIDLKVRENIKTKDDKFINFLIQNDIEG